LWGIFLRTVFGLHATYLVNSATHMWGSRRFTTSDKSRNNLLVAMLSWGEGWHNNHHAHPQSARHGLAWYEFDVNWYMILLLRALGLAWDIKLPKWSAQGVGDPAAASADLLALQTASRP
jgi:stearoyl-CoA desaturase (delta-9 desaturase)